MPQFPSTLSRRYWRPMAVSVILVGGTAVAQAQDAVFASYGSIAIGYADDFALAENPVPLAQSDNLLVKADDAQTGGSGSGSSSGCSIAGTGARTGQASLLGMLLLAIAGLVFRRR